MLEKLFSCIDIFGIPILLNFSKSKKTKSGFGGFCSVLFLCFVVWSIYNSGYELFAREKPQIIDGTTYSEVPRPAALSSKGLPLAFAVLKDDYTMDTQFCQYAYYIQGSDALFNLERCTSEHLNIKSDVIEADYNISDYLCFPLNSNFPLTASKFSVSITCEQKEGREDFFAQTPEAVVIYPKNGLTLRDYENPVTLYFDIDRLPLVSNTSILNTWSLSHLSITTDDGWLTASEEVSEYLEVTRLDSRNYPDDERPGVLYQFSVSKQETSHLRSYKRIQNVLAEVGGIANAVFTVLLVMISPYARIKFSEAFVNELFDIKRNKRDEKRASKTSKPQKPATETPENLENVNSKKLESKSASLKLQISQVIEMQDQNKKEAFQYKIDASIEKESKYYLSVNNKASENFSSPRPNENQSLLPQQRDEESNVHLEPKMVSKPFRSARLSFQKAYTQPSQAEHSPRLESAKRKDKMNKKKGASSAIELDDFLHQFDSPNNSHQINFEGSDLCPVNVQNERKIELLKVDDAQDIENSKRELKRESYDNTNRLSSKADAYKVTDKRSRKSLKSRKITKSNSINISVFEYMWSFVSRSESLKEKMAILNEGLKTLDDRLDVLSLLKKMRDMDKLKGLLFDKDQLFLFDRTQRPEIMNRATHWYIEEYLPYHQIFKDSEDQILNVKLKIQDKQEKSEIDKKLLHFFKDISIDEN